jgi:hypothetical protein
MDSKFVQARVSSRVARQTLRNWRCSSLVNEILLRTLPVGTKPAGAVHRDVGCPGGVAGWNRAERCRDSRALGRWRGSDSRVEIRIARTLARCPPLSVVVSERADCKIAA